MSRPFRHRLTIVPGLLAALLTVSAGELRAQVSDAEQVLAALDSPDYRQRQDQTLALLADDAIELDDLAELFARARSVEQRHRLLGVARHHVLRQRREQVFDRPDRGSLGISHRTLGVDELPEHEGHDGAAVEILFTLPGFPAHGRLEAGDRVIALGGEPLPRDFTAEDFRNRIVNFRSGDELQLTIERQGEQLTRTVPLASAQALGAMYDPVGLHLRPQFENDWQEIRRSLELEPPGEPLRLATSDVDGR